MKYVLVFLVKDYKGLGIQVSGVINQDTFVSCDDKDDIPHTLVHGKKPQEERKLSILHKGNAYLLRKALKKNWRGKGSVSDRRVIQNKIKRQEKGNQRSDYLFMHADEHAEKGMHTEKGLKNLH